MEIGDGVVVRLGESEVLGKVTRVTTNGIEISFKMPLPSTALGGEQGKLVWANGKEELFSTARANVVASVTLPLQQSSKVERRTVVRLRCRVAAEVSISLPQGDRTIATGSPSDLSSDGAKLRLNRGLKVGEQVNVALHLDEDCVELEAVAMRQRRLEDDSHEVGVRFLQTAGDAKSRLVRFVFARLRSAMGPFAHR